VLITDSPGHGHELNDDKNDQYPQGDPQNPLTAQQVIGEMTAKEIDFMMCRIKRHATLKMERKFRQLYNTEDRKLTSIDLFDDSKVPITGAFHIVFCLDESGSMAGGRWTSLQQAYHLFLNQRCNDQAQGDLVSVIQFSRRAHKVLEKKSLSFARSADLIHNGGGTRFEPALLKAQQVLNTAPGYTPMLVFMSDGDDGGGHGALNVMADIYREHKSAGLQVYCIPFASGSSGHARLQALAQRGHGELRAASSGQELSQVFNEIAQGCNAMDGLISAFGNKISSMVVKKLLMDFY
jgi:Mg-chelatase subunit ChlD